MQFACVSRHVEDGTIPVGVLEQGQLEALVSMQVHLPVEIIVDRSQTALQEKVVVVGRNGQLDLGGGNFANWAH